MSRFKFIPILHTYDINPTFRVPFECVDHPGGTGLVSLTMHTDLHHLKKPTLEFHIILCSEDKSPNFTSPAPSTPSAKNRRKNNNNNNQKKSSASSLLTVRKFLCHNIGSLESWQGPGDSVLFVLPIYLFILKYSMSLLRGFMFSLALNKCQHPTQSAA